MLETLFVKDYPGNHANEGVNPYWLVARVSSDPVHKEGWRRGIDQLSFTVLHPTTRGNILAVAVAVAVPAAVRLTCARPIAADGSGNPGSRENSDRPACSSGDSDSIATQGKDGRVHRYR